MFVCLDLVVVDTLVSLTETAPSLSVALAVRLDVRGQTTFGTVPTEK